MRKHAESESRMSIRVAPERYQEVAELAGIQKSDLGEAADELIRVGAATLAARRRFQAKKQTSPSAMDDISEIITAVAATDSAKTRRVVVK